jgi:hypothetical protein
VAVVAVVALEAPARSQGDYVGPPPTTQVTDAGSTTTVGAVVAGEQITPDVGPAQPAAQPEPAGGLPLTGSDGLRLLGIGVAALVASYVIRATRRRGAVPPAEG